MAPGFIDSDFKLNLLVVYQGNWEDQKPYLWVHNGLKYSNSGWKEAW